MTATPYHLTAYVERPAQLDGWGGRLHRKVFIESAFDSSDGLSGYTAEQILNGHRYCAGVITRVLIEVVPLLTPVRDSHECSLTEYNDEAACGYARGWNLLDPGEELWEDHPSGFVVVPGEPASEPKRWLAIVRATMARVLEGDRRPARPRPVQAAPATHHGTSVPIEQQPTPTQGADRS